MSPFAKAPQQAGRAPPRARTNAWATAVPRRCAAIAGSPRTYGEAAFSV